MDVKNQTRLKQILELLPTRLRTLLLRLPDSVAENLLEIRLRSTQPILLVTPQNNLFLSNSGKPTCIYTETLPVVLPAELSDILAHACGYSVHSHQEELKNGFITVAGGHRLGICGTAVYENGRITGVRQVKALNLRISHQIDGAAAEVLCACFQTGLQNILLAGPPMSGKTTVLRDLVRQISLGYAGCLYKCVVLDERAELFAYDEKECERQNAWVADVLAGYPKASGISLAVRTLSPDMIFCDEIGEPKDAQAILQGIQCGVHFAATAHADSVSALQKRKGVCELLTQHAVETIIFLDTGKNVGKIKEIIRVGEQRAQNSRAAFDSGRMRLDGHLLRRAGA